jgi:hypothetical protein
MKGLPRKRWRALGALAASLLVALAAILVATGGGERSTKTGRGEPSGGERDGTGIVARAGRFVVRARDSALRERLIRLEHPEESRPLGTYQLCRAFELAAVLEAHGRPITDAALDAEARRIETATRDREAWQRIRALFGDDEAAYRRVYVLPVLAHRIVPFDFFRNDPAVQGESRLRAERFLEAARAAPARAFAEANRFDRQGTFEIDPAAGFRWLPARGGGERHVAAADPVEGRRWLAELVPPLRAGAVVDRVVDLGERWMVARYRGRVGAAHRFDAALFEKGDFHRWLEEALRRHPEARCVETS